MSDSWRLGDKPDIAPHERETCQNDDQTKVSHGNQTIFLIAQFKVCLNVYYNTGTCIKFAESDPVFNGKIEQLPSIFNDKYYKE